MLINKSKIAKDIGINKSALVESRMKQSWKPQFEELNNRVEEVYQEWLKTFKKTELESLNYLMDTVDSIIELKECYTEMLAVEKATPEIHKSFGDIKENLYQKEIDNCVQNLINISGKISEITSNIKKLSV